MNTIAFWYLTKKEVHRFTSVWYSVLLPPIIYSLISLLVFGYVLGERLHQGTGTSYAEFILPGLLLMTVMASAMHNSSFSIFGERYFGNIREIVAAPLSNSEIILANCIGSICKSAIIFFGTYVPFLFLSPVPLHSIPATVVLTLLVTLAAALFGLIIGLFASEWDHLFVWEPFLIMPLTILGGAFYSISALPAEFQAISAWNPFFYIVNSYRYAMTGVSDTPVWIGWAISIALCLLLYGAVHSLFKKGHNIRD